MARRQVFRLGEGLGAAIVPPPLVGEGGVPNAGYVTAAGPGEGGEALVALWVERRDRPTLVHELVLLALGEEGGWREVIDEAAMAEAGFLRGEPAFDRVVALAPDPAGRLWLASNAPALAVWEADAGGWVTTWSAEELGLSPDAIVRDLVLTSDGSAWLATSEGLVVGRRPVAATLHVPYGSVERP